MTTDQTVTSNTQCDQFGGSAAGEPGKVLRASDGSHIPAPPDLPTLLEHRNYALSLTDSIISAVQRVDFDAIAGLEDLTRAASAADPFVPGGSAYAEHVKISALRAFVLVLRSGDANERIARQQAEQQTGQQQQHGTQRQDVQDPASTPARDGKQVDEQGKRPAEPA